MSDRIRVLFHLDWLLTGGLERKVCRIAKNLDPERFCPVVSYAWDWGPCGDDLRSAGIPVHRNLPWTPHQPPAHEAVRQIREIGPQIYHSFSCGHNAHDVWAANEAKVPVIMTARGGVRSWAPPGPAQNWEFDRNALTHHVTACCEAVAGAARSAEGIHPDKISVIYNGVELPAREGPSIRDELAFSAERLLVGYAAKYYPLKAHDRLLRAWREVVAAIPSALLVCCGDDDNYKHILESLISSLQLDHKVKLLDMRDDMDAFYRGLDLYVHPSKSEGFSNAILEAMSHGKPVIALSVGGTPEAIEDGVSGLLAGPETRDFAGAILKLAESPDVRGAMGQAARRRVEQRFSISQMVRGYEQVYLKFFEKPVIEVNSPPPPIHYTGDEKATVLDDTTVFLTTIGDSVNFADCLVHLETQTVRCRFEVIDHVRPISAAFAQMQSRCRTPYYVQVDEDMLLNPNALEQLRELIGRAEPSVPLVCAPLWDCDASRPILGVKIYRYDIVKRFPYHDILSCEVNQLKRMANAGHHALVLSSDEADAVCLGEHGKHYTPQTIFRRWQRLFHKHNELGNQRWMDPWPRRLLDRYMETKEDLHLYAALGAIAGIGSRADRNRELDWLEPNPALMRMQHYFPLSGEAPDDVSG